MLYKYSDFAEAAVVGAAHPDLGEKIGAGVDLKSAAVATAEELRDFVKESVAGHKHPRNTHILDALPKVPPGNPQV
ncbi:hypothetical protein AXA44_42940 [Rhodococcus sp. SC4]|nr:hypothetical protein AXA44_42940 [Rhodococcus sp. SC4]